MVFKWIVFLAVAVSAMLLPTDATDACSLYQGNIMATCGGLLDAGNVDGAVAFANDLVNSLPHCVDSFQCAGIVAYMNGELVTSITAFEKVRNG